MVLLAEIAPSPLPSRQKPRFLPAAKSIAAPNSAESAAGDFQPTEKKRISLSK
jgi:hypothetical protein